MSEYIKTGNGSRFHKDMVGAVTLDGSRVFITGRNGNLITILKFDADEEAELELENINAQMDDAPKTARKS